MTYYDDADVDCPRCSTGLKAVDLCEHDVPMCPRCCAVERHEDIAYWNWLRLGMVS